MVDEAREMAVVTAAMCSGETAIASWGEDAEAPEIVTESGSSGPQIAMSCKGPRKKHLLFGELVCRGKAKVDTV